MILVRLVSIIKRAALETILNNGWPMRYTIVNMHDRSQSTCTAPAVHGLRKRPEYLFTEVAVIESSSGENQLMNVVLWTYKSNLSIIFEQLWYA
jgi:hypothetical protein